MSAYSSLSASFLKIGLLGFGGGYAMLPLIQHEIVQQRNWMADAAFADMVALSQLTPGPIAINAATYLGYTVAVGDSPDAARLAGFAGAALATACVCLPPFLLVLAASFGFQKLRQQPRLRRVMSDLRPVLVGMVAATAFLLLLEPTTITNWTASFIFAAVLVLSLRTKCHPAVLLAAAGAAGAAFG